MIENFTLEMNKRIYSELNDAVLFVNQFGEIIWGNQVAHELLMINQSTKQSFIDDYFDLNLPIKKRNKHLIMKQKNNKSFIDVKLIELDCHNYCLILQKVGLEDNAVAIKKHKDQLVYVSTEGLVMFDHTHIIDCDLEFASLFGYSQKELIGMHIGDLVKDVEKPLVLVAENNHDHHREGANELVGIKKTGETFHIEMISRPYDQQGNTMRIAIVKDISERIRYEKHLDYMAYYDELTDLPNRNYFIKVLEDAIQQAKDNGEIFSVSFIDLDYFKEINETLGYDFGDRLLTACGEKLRAFKDINTFIARMNGDKFLLLQRYIAHKNTSIAIAKNIIAAFEKPIHINGYDIFTSVSIGISIYPENGETPNDLIKHADAAMYMIKEKHRNRYKLFESSISEEFKMMLTMENDLRKAISKGQFELHYQPQKRLKTNELVGMEALLRWNHPEKGYIPPMEFIPLAEKTGLIIEIGDWVLEEACRQNKEWQVFGYKPIIIGVNLSAKQFHQKNLLEKIEETLAKTGLDPKYLELEITESMAMSNEKMILKTMYRLRDIGVHVSIDDFGTGYSSLRYLSMFPVSKLKIDKTFMDRKQKQNKAIVRSIINMSHSLQMTVIAEGVETLNQKQFLEKENCDEIQGYYFSKPLPPDQLVSFFHVC